MPRGIYIRAKPPWNKGRTGVYSDEALARMGWNNIGRAPSNKGQKLSDEGRAKLSEAHQGQIAWNKGIPQTNETKEKIRESCQKYIPTEEAKKRQSYAQREQGRARRKDFISIPVVTEWRRQVFERDNWTCQFCGQRGGRLEADHIQPKCQRPDLVYVVDNGRTLCRSCHQQTPTYGRKSIGIGVQEFQLPLEVVL